MKLFSYYISECESQTSELRNKINSNKSIYGLKEDERIIISYNDVFELIPYESEFLIPKEYTIFVQIRRFWNESFLDDDITEVIDIEREELVFQSHFTVGSKFFAISKESKIKLEKKVVEHLEISK